MRRSMIHHVASKPELAAEFSKAWLDPHGAKLEGLSFWLGFKSRMSAHRLAKQLGLPMRKRGPKGVPFTEAMRVRLIEGRAAGFNDVALRKELGLTHSSYYRFLHKHDVPLKGKRA